MRSLPAMEGRGRRSRTATCPSLVSLCLEAAKKDLLRWDDLLPGVYELPSELFDELVSRSPPLVLHKLHTERPDCKFDEDQVFVQCPESGKKRGRCSKFDSAWKALFKLRWPAAFEQLEPVDWHQAYWEAHLQDCLDEAAARASLPSYEGRISGIVISERILDFLGCGLEGCSFTSSYSTLHHHCRQFGYYSRSLRLQNVLCVGETCDLLRNCRLESLIIRWIRSQDHVKALCNLLVQNAETLTSIEFIHCKLSSSFIDTICSSFYLKDMQCHGIQNFSMHASSIIDHNAVAVPPALSSFLSSGRSFNTLKLCDNRLDCIFARLVFNTLLDASSDLTMLDLSENNIGGWLSNFSRSFLGGSQSSSLDGKMLRSLHILKLRGNNLQKEDMDNLSNVLPLMPRLEILDISDNPIEDAGVRRLMSFFSKASEEQSPLHELNLGNCDLSCNAVTELFNTISSLKKPLRSLSIGENNLGSQVAASLRGLFGLCTILNIGEIGLGSSGFHELQKIDSSDVKLTKIDISKNRGGIEAAKFLLMLIERAPELVMVNASYNFMPAESLTILNSSLKLAKAKLEHLDLRGNSWKSLPDDVSELLDLKHEGKPVVLFSSPGAPEFAYDDDP